MLNKSVIWAIARKDIRSITANKQVWIPLLILPFIFCVFMPGVVVFVSRSFTINPSTAEIVSKFLNNMPAGDLHNRLLHLPSINHQLIYIFINYLMTPLFLLVPLITSGIMAANSFVGEKERRTLESLLYSPISIKDLFIGKILASLVPSLVISFGGFILCGIVVDALTFRMFGGLIFPGWTWLVVMLWLVPIITLFSIMINVIISARVKSFQEAQQLSGLVALPFILLLISQITGLLIVSPLLLICLGGLLLIIMLSLLPLVARMNNRNLLFEKQIH